MKCAIAIPARYGSTRFPGKPLVPIGNLTMLERVVRIARSAAQACDDVSIFVTTEDKRIADHAKEINVPCIITPASCRTGSDRVLSAIRQLDQWPDFIVNLQGDAPFTPPNVIERMIEAFKNGGRPEVVTPAVQLSWEALDKLRDSKKSTPFSGTTVTFDEKGNALWFSKNIIPAIRKEDDLRSASPLSPVWQHMGLYGFRSDVLEKFCTLTEGKYEALEGLEQLRLLENGINIKIVPVELAHGAMQSGIDSPEDIKRAEAYIKQHGELVA